MQRWMILSFPMAVLLGCSGIGGPDYEPFVDSYVIEEKISDESYRVYRFDLPTSGRDFSLSGWFKVTSGGSHDINAYVVDATEFTNFRSGNNFYPLYSRNRVTTGRFDNIPLSRERGPFYFILSNRFSLFTDKWVEGEVTLQYERKI